VPTAAGDYRNQIEELLNYVSETYPESLPDTELHERLQPSATAASDQRLAAFVDALRQQSDVEDRKSAEQQRSTVRPTPLNELLVFEQHDSPSSFQMCRLLLSHLGLLSTEQLRRFKPIDANSKFFRVLHQLDKTSSRENMKVGLMYVAEGQEHQYDILRNEHGSKLYQSFANGLGWLVSLKNHAGFLGGLAPSPNLNTYYFADRSFEVVFHEVTRLPTDPRDANQVEKKKHIGNDIVNIIFTEHKRDYRPTTVTSQFNFAHIVVYPLPTGLFRIQVYRKDSVALFGPLLDGMVIGKRVLSILVRQTAMIANRIVRYTQPGYERPYPARKTQIIKIAESYKKEMDFKDFMSSLFIVPPKAGKEEEPAARETTAGGQ